MGISVSFIRVDFPEPLTPEMPISIPRGKVTSMFLRLFPHAPRSTRVFPLPAALSEGVTLGFTTGRGGPL